MLNLLKLKNKLIGYNPSRSYDETWESGTWSYGIWENGTWESGKSCDDESGDGAGTGSEN